MRYALSRAGLERLHEWLSHRPLLAFDIDGTLAPIVSRPWDARVPGAVQSDLAILSEWTVVAVVTGRAVADAKPMLGFTPRYLIGNNGAEGVPGYEAQALEFARICRSWIEQLCGPDEPWRSIPHLTLEDKTSTLAFHYRHAKHKDAVERLIEQRAQCLVPQPTLLEGKFVLNLMPPGAPQKGEAMPVLLRHSACDRAVYVGDDVSDEAVFRLRSPALLTVRIDRVRSSAAELYLKSQAEVPRFVGELARLARAEREELSLQADERRARRA
jgi:trehalose 6-phosphate phosphatase